MLGTVAEIQLSRLFSGMKKSEWEHNGNGKIAGKKCSDPIKLKFTLLHKSHCRCNARYVGHFFKENYIFFAEHSIIPPSRKEEVKGTLNCPTKFVSL